MTKFHDYKMAGSDSVAQHIAKIENMARQLSDLGENLSVVTIMAKILGSLPSKFSAFVTAWDSVDPDKQSLESLTTRLIKEETRITAMDDTTSALAAINISKSRKFNDKKFVKKSDEKKSDEERRNVECYYCHEKGHVIKYCPKKRKFNYKRNNTEHESRDNKHEGNISAFSTETDMKMIFKRLDENDTWLMNSGASKHITFQKRWLHNFQEIGSECVAVGNGTSCEVKGRGTVYIKRNV